MKTIIIHAGLANKMFEYAFYKGLEAKGYDVAVDFDTFKPVWNFEDISLNDAFAGLHYQEDKTSNLAKKWLYKNSTMGKIMRRLLSHLPNDRFVRERKYAYDPSITTLFTKDCTIYGLWQTEKYFIHCRETILQEFTFKPLTGEKNLAFAENTVRENAISIHVRKGKDYAHLDKTCPIGYYQKAIDYMLAHVEAPHFYVFTDNKEWVNQNFSELPIKYEICDWNPVSGKESFRDMQLISLCKHHIMANSSFSWWGAYLDRNPDKIVIAPKTWFGNSKKGFFADVSDLLPDEWITL